MLFPRIYPLSEAAVTVEFDTVISVSANNQVMALHSALLGDPFPGFVESVPAYNTLTVYFDIFRVHAAFHDLSGPAVHCIGNLINEKISRLTPTSFKELPLTEIPVCYDLSVAPDLPWVAEYCRISIPEVIRLHTSQDYRVYMIGFIPGFPYMGMLPSALEVPRKLRPALMVPAGSVALAGRQTGIYPFSIPGGWQVIGRTPVRLFDVEQEPACMFKSGQQVRFFPISIDEFNRKAGL